jgi:hypothetical protein
LALAAAKSWAFMRFMATNFAGIPASQMSKRPLLLSEQELGPPCPGHGLKPVDGSTEASGMDGWRPKAVEASGARDTEGGEEEEPATQPRGGSHEFDLTSGVGTGLRGASMLAPPAAGPARPTIENAGAACTEDDGVSKAVTEKAPRDSEGEEDEELAVQPRGGNQDDDLRGGCHATPEGLYGTSMAAALLAGPRRLATELGDSVGTWGTAGERPLPKGPSSGGRRQSVGGSKESVASLDQPIISTRTSTRLPKGAAVVANVGDENSPGAPGATPGTPEPRAAAPGNTAQFRSTCERRCCWGVAALPSHLPLLVDDEAGTNGGVATIRVGS